jgi:hypothetical protein
MASCAFFGVDQTTPERNAADTASGTSTTPSLTINSANLDMAVCAILYEPSGVNTVTPDAPATLIGTPTDNVGTGGGAYSAASGATRVIAWTASLSSLWGLAGVSLVPASAATKFRNLQPSQIGLRAGTRTAFMP